MNYERYNLENDRPTEDLDNNWSWKEKGNEQYKICNAPDSSLPELSPDNITPLNQKNLGSITENLLSDQNSELNKAIDTFVEKEVDKDVNTFHGKKQGDYVELEDGTTFLVG
ncbi:16418_t:CDS:2 [Dentiscutata erythropus]|uniref:16418_t:CDS:1 n=1 Tax=Dentiscutata erythropus TaxID=1348616 RepID=A0A9N9HW70_9GLOM|nr:16418_t:CDS:2 [Dentiscutata erythropus]